MEITNYYLYILLNTFVYFIFVTSYCPFMMTTVQRVILSVILFISLVITSLTENVGVILLLLSIGLYLYKISKDIPKKAVCFFLTSYLITVLTDSVLSMIANALVGNIFDPDHLFAVFVYSSAVSTVLLFIRYMLSRLGIWQKLCDIPEETFGFILINLIVCTTLFVVNIAMGAYIGYSTAVLIFNGIMFWGYFTITTVTAVRHVQEMTRKAEAENARRELAAMQEYTRQIENMYSSVRAFRHDYTNLLLSLNGYLENDDITGLKDYYHQEVLPQSREITDEPLKLNQLMNITIQPVKALISSKLIYAHVQGIRVELEVHDKIDQLRMGYADLVRVLGVFLDNAAEAALETADPWIGMAIFQKEDTVCILISNTCVNHGIALSDLGQKGVSSKGEGRGLGLWNASVILKKYPDIIWEKNLQDDKFTQRLTLPAG